MHEFSADRNALRCTWAWVIAPFCDLEPIILPIEHMHLVLLDKLLTVMAFAVSVCINRDDNGVHSMKNSYPKINMQHLHTDLGRKARNKTPNMHPSDVTCITIRPVGRFPCSQAMNYGWKRRGRDDNCDIIYFLVGADTGKSVLGRPVRCRKNTVHSWHV